MAESFNIQDFNPPAKDNSHLLNTVLDQYRAGAPAHSDLPVHQLPSPNSRPANSNLRPGEKPHEAPPQPQVVPGYNNGDRSTVPDTSPVIMAPSNDSSTRRTGITPEIPGSSPAPGRSDTMPVPDNNRRPGSDAYFNGDRSQMGHLGYTIHAGIDLAAIAGGSYVANSMVRNRFDDRFVADRMLSPDFTQRRAFDDLQTLMRRAHEPEIRSLTNELSPRLRALGVGNNIEGIARLSPNTLTASENRARLRLFEINAGGAEPAAVARATEAASTPELKAMVQRGAESFTRATAEREATLTAAQGLQRFMRQGSLVALGVGEAANVGMDYTLFNKTPHTLRTAAFDAAAAFVVLSPLSRAAKLGTIVGTHFVNRVWDANTQDAGKI